MQSNTYKITNAVTGEPITRVFADTKEEAFKVYLATRPGYTAKVIVRKIKTK